MAGKRNTAEKFQLVIVGGGVAGMAMATRLGRELGRSGKADIILVDKGFAHVWKPMLHCFAAGTAVNENDRINFLSQASRNYFHFWPGEIAQLDRANRHIVLAPVKDPSGVAILPERQLHYDALIFAIGSRANDFGTPGVAQHCLFIDNLVEANSFNEKFRMALLKAYGAGEQLEIAIVGGGATGVQLAAELRKALELASLYNFGIAQPNLKITLLEAGPKILPAFPETVSQAAREQLERIGVAVKTSAMVSAADENGFQLKDGSHIRASLRVWAAGIKAPDVTSQFSDMSRARGGQLMVLPSLRSKDDEHIFAVGDCSFMESNPAPPTAQVARQQAHHLTRYLPGWINGKPIPAFSFDNRGAIVALGDYNGWGTFPNGKIFGGGRWKGFNARLSHILLYRQHQIELYGLWRGSISWFTDWLDLFVRPAVRLD